MKSRARRPTASSSPTRAATMVEVNVAIRPEKREWNFSVGENEKLGLTLQRFCEQSELSRDAHVFRENYKEIDDGNTALDLKWRGSAIIDAVLKTKTYKLKFRTVEGAKSGVSQHSKGPNKSFAECDCVVLKSDRLDPVFAQICATWNIKRKKATFCIDSERLFGDHLVDSLNLQSSPPLGSF